VRNSVRYRPRAFYRPAALAAAGYEVDVEKIMAASAQHGVALEINANP
jgi:hypothetical protein